MSEALLGSAFYFCSKTVKYNQKQENAQDI